MEPRGIPSSATAVRYLIPTFRWFAGMEIDPERMDRAMQVVERRTGLTRQRIEDWL